MGSSTLSLEWHGYHHDKLAKPTDMLIAGVDHYRVQGRCGDVQIKLHDTGKLCVTGTVVVGGEHINVAMASLTNDEVNALIGYIKGKASNVNGVIRRNRRILRIKRMRESFKVGESEDGITVPIFSHEGVCVGYVMREAKDEYGEQWVALDTCGTPISKGLSREHAINELARFYCENIH